MLSINQSLVSIQSRKLAFPKTLYTYIATYAISDQSNTNIIPLIANRRTVQE